MSFLMFNTFLTPIPRKIWHVLAVMCLRVNCLAPVACDFNCLIETKGLFKFTDSRIHGKSGNISEMVQDRDVVTTNHYQEMTYSLSNGSVDDLESPSRSCT